MNKERDFVIDEETGIKISLVCGWDDPILQIIDLCPNLKRECMMTSIGLKAGHNFGMQENNVDES